MRMAHARRHDVMYMAINSNLNNYMLIEIYDEPTIHGIQIRFALPKVTAS
jgi:hypothetical protein